MSKSNNGAMWAQIAKATLTIIVSVGSVLLAKQNKKKNKS